LKVKVEEAAGRVVSLTVNSFKPVLIENEAEVKPLVVIALASSAGSTVPSSSPPFALRS